MIELQINFICNTNMIDTIVAIATLVFTILSYNKAKANK